ncbi:MAG: GxxExxY protein [Planctomycetes bacterium]|nr:GxxExxY protein [Planctomycetota bacterium]
MQSNWNVEHVERIAKEVVDTCIKIHKKIGPGLLESVYVKVLVRELVKRGFRVEMEVPVNVFWEDEDLGVGFRADVIVDGIVILEVKSTEAVAKVHAKQALTYARLKELPLAFVLNFGQALMKDGIERVANDYYGNPA